MTQNEINEIGINCSGAEYIPIEDFHDLQGNLKKLRPDGYDKLRASILKYGIISPYFAWRDKNNAIWIIDAHQRNRILKDLKRDGYIIPKMPTVFIKASGKREAKEKLLVLNSRYAKITGEGLHEFICEDKLEIDLAGFEDVLDLPDVDIEDFLSQWNAGGELIDSRLEDDGFSPSRGLSNLKWDNKIVPLQEEEVGLLNKAFDDYIEEFGVSAGFVFHIMGSNPDGV
ncbi:MAG: hypothetical protein ACLFQX_08275 [Candidatus Kapaibacterium sp.]